MILKYINQMPDYITGGSFNESLKPAISDQEPGSRNYNLAFTNNNKKEEWKNNSPKFL